jgi:chromosome segregation ATPase
MPASPEPNPPRAGNRQAGWRSVLGRWLLRLACPQVADLDALSQKLYALSGIVQNLRRRVNDIEGDIEALDDAIASLKMDVREARSIALDVDERFAAFEAASKKQQSRAREQ